MSLDDDVDDIDDDDYDDRVRYKMVKS